MKTLKFVSIFTIFYCIIVLCNSRIMLNKDYYYYYYPDLALTAFTLPFYGEHSLISDI